MSGNTIRSTGGSAAGVQGSNMRVEGNDIAGTADGLKVGSNTVVTGNWIHDLWEGQTASGPTHNDGIQMQGGSNVLIQGNTISHAGQQANSAVFFKSDSGPISDVNVINNPSFMPASRVVGSQRSARLWRSVCSPYRLTCPLPVTMYVVVVISARAIGPRACSFCVEMPISAPNPNSPPSVNRVDALIITAAESTPFTNASIVGAELLTMASV